GWATARPQKPMNSGSIRKNLRPFRGEPTFSHIGVIDVVTSTSNRSGIRPLIGPPRRRRTVADRFGGRPVAAVLGAELVDHHLRTFGEIPDAPVQIRRNTFDFVLNTLGITKNRVVSRVVTQKDKDCPMLVDPLGLDR